MYSSTPLYIQTRIRDQEWQKAVSVYVGHKKKRSNEITMQNMETTKDKRKSKSWVKVPISCAGILHIRILWVFPIKNVTYLLFEDFIFMEIFEV